MKNNAGNKIIIQNLKVKIKNLVFAFCFVIRISNIVFHSTFVIFKTFVGKCKFTGVLPVFTTISPGFK